MSHNVVCFFRFLLCVLEFGFVDATKKGETNEVTAGLFKHDILLAQFQNL
jgi:hypothetical protein